MRYVKVLALVIIFFFSMIFFVQNTDLLTQGMALRLDIFKWQFKSQEVPFYLLTLGGFIVGSFLSLMYFITDKFKSGKQVKIYKAKAAKLEEELNSLRNIPLDEAPAPSPAPVAEVEAEEAPKE